MSKFISNTESIYAGPNQPFDIHCLIISSHLKKVDFFANLVSAILTIPWTFHTCAPLNFHSTEGAFSVMTTQVNVQVWMRELGSYNLPKVH